MRPFREPRDARLQPRDLLWKPLEHPLVAEDVERREAHRRRERIAAVGVAVEERALFGVRAEERVPDASGRERGRHREVARREPLREAEEVGHDRLLFAGEHRARAAEADGDLVEDEEHVVPPGDLAHATQEALGMDEHAARHLHEWLHDHGRDRAGMGGEERLELGERLGERRRRRRTAPRQRG